jgi:hypothetical protein
MPAIAADFAAAVRGKRNFDSMQDAVDTALATAKITANGAHQRISANLRTLTAQVEHATLFADEAVLVQKAPDDLALVIRTRIADHQDKEAKRLEAEREKIRAEEQAKAQREADARAAEALRLQRAEDARVAAEAAAEAAAALAAAAPPPPASAAAPAPAPSAPAVVPFQRAAAPMPATNEAATMKLGTICDRLGFTLTAAFVSEVLGIRHSATDKAAKLYKPSDFPRICDALVQHIGSVCELQAA